MGRLERPAREPDLQIKPDCYSEDKLSFWWEEKVQYNSFSGQCYHFNPNNWTWLMSNDRWSPYSNFLTDKFLQEVNESYLKWLIEKELLNDD